MESKRVESSRKITVWLAELCLACLCLSIVGCNEPTSTSSVTSATPAASPVSSVAAVPTNFAPGVAGLQANPNPVPAGVQGKTTISWQTGTEDPGEVYLVEDKGERLFARGAAGSAEAPWISPGSTRFRLYRGTAHQEVLAELTVTMDSAPGASITPATSSSP